MRTMGTYSFPQVWQTQENVPFVFQRRLRRFRSKGCPVTILSYLSRKQGKQTWQIWREVHVGGGCG